MKRDRYRIILSVEQKLYIESRNTTALHDVKTRYEDHPPGNVQLQNASLRFPEM